MRYRRLSYRYTLVQRGAWPAAPWAESYLSLYLGRPRWRPDADMCETPAGFEVVVDLAGVAEDDVEIQLFDNALVVEGHRQVPECGQGAVYHAVGVRQGPFRLELPLPAPVDAENGELRYDRGLLRIRLKKLEARG